MSLVLRHFGFWNRIIPGKKQVYTLYFLPRDKGFVKKMSRDSFGSFSSPLKAVAQSAQRDSFGSFQEYKVESNEDTKENSLEIVMEESPTEHLEVPDTKRSYDIQSEMSIFTDETVFFNFTASDPVQTALNKCFTFEEMIAMKSRTLMSLDEAQKSGKNVLDVLISNQSWFAITQYTRNELVACSPELDKVDHIMKLWDIRLLALFKLKEYDALEHEFKNLGDLNRESLLYENFKNTGLIGPIIPFQIALMYCRVPLLTQKYTEAIERSYQLLYSLKYKDKSCDILSHIGTCLLKMEEYFLATEVFKCISESFDDTDPQKLEWDSNLGRILLQVGDLEYAAQVFENVSKKSVDNSRLVLMNNALLAISKGKWEEASLQFSQILEIYPNDWVVGNNMAIVKLYNGQMSEALALLDDLLINNPKELAKSSEAIFNLCTVYDLLDQSLERKKKVLANVITPFAGDDFHIGSLKL